MGKGAEDEWKTSSTERMVDIRKGLLRDTTGLPETPGAKPEVSGLKRAFIRLEGVHVGEEGKVTLHVDGGILGFLPRRPSGPMCLGYPDTSSDEYSSSSKCFQLPVENNRLPESPPALRLIRSDEGTWFVSESAELLVEQDDGKLLRVAQWVPDCTSGLHRSSPEADFEHAFGEYMSMQLLWCKPVEVHG